MTAIGKSGLCGARAELKQSHRTPKFVFRWLKETSPGGIRLADNINVRAQDGWKDPYLCAACEGRFGAWEREFADHIFRPYHDRDRDPKEALRYGDWCLPLCVSVSWRILSYSVAVGDMPALSEKQHAAVEIALSTWRAFLLGMREHPGIFEQHIFPVDVLDSGPAALMSPFLSRYLLRAVQEDVIASQTEVMTFAKLGRLILIGFVARGPGWKECKVSVRKGCRSPRMLDLPYKMGIYLKENAERCARALASMSDRQRQLAQTSTVKAIQGDMEVYRAMQYDVWHTGDEAFWISRRHPAKS